MPDNDTTVLLDLRSDTELRRLARAGRPDVAQESLKILARRGDPRLPTLAREVVLGHGDLLVRATAAVSLRDDDSPATREALVAALQEPAPAVRRRVAQALGRVGDLTALAALDRLDVPPGTPVGRDVAMARTLIAYRYGVPGHLLGGTDGLQRLRVTKGTDIQVRGSVGVARATLANDAARELPGHTVTATQVHPIRCSGVAGAIVLTVGGRNAASAPAPADFTTPRLVGALIRERVCSERFTLDAYILTDDRDETGGERIRIWLVRPDGTVVHGGTADVSDPGISFVINEANPPYGKPIRLSGSLDITSGALTVDEAVIGGTSRADALGAAPSARS